MAELLERWPRAVGETIARFAAPARIGRDGTVHIHTADSVWAFELTQRGGEIAARVGVGRVRFAPGPLPSAELEQEERQRPSPTREDRKQAAQIAAVIEDENLRETVQKAVALSLAAGALDRSV